MKQEELNEKIKSLVLYVVVNANGQFFRAKGFSGSGKTWVDDINLARLYAKLGPARSAATFFAKDPYYAVPDIVKINMGSYEVMVEERERALKAVFKIKKQKEQQKVNNAKYHLDIAERNYKAAAKGLEEAKKNIMK